MKLSLEKLALLACLGTGLSINQQLKANDDSQAQTEHDVVVEVEEAQNPSLEQIVSDELVKYCCKAILAESQPKCCEHLFNQAPAPKPQTSPENQDQIPSEALIKHCCKVMLEEAQNNDLQNNALVDEQDPSMPVVKNCCKMVMNVLNKASDYYKCPCNQRPSAPTPKPQAPEAPKPETPDQVASKAILKHCCKTMLEEAINLSDMELVQSLANVMTELKEIE